MLDITKIKSVTQTRIFFINDTHEQMTLDKAIELYNITSHLIYAIPVLEEINNRIHIIPFREYKETDNVEWFDKIHIEITNKYARLENERLVGNREQCRNIVETFRNFKRINATCKEYIKING